MLPYSYKTMGNTIRWRTERGWPSVKLTLRQWSCNQQNMGKNNASECRLAYLWPTRRLWNCHPRRWNTASIFGERAPVKGLEAGPPVTDTEAVKLPSMEKTTASVLGGTTTRWRSRTVWSPTQHSKSYSRGRANDGNSRIRIRIRIRIS